MGSSNKPYVVAGLLLALLVSLATPPLFDVQPSANRLVRILLIVAPFVVIALLLWLAVRNKRDRP